jgi:hypothetical protein
VEERLLVARFLKIGFHQVVMDAVGCLVGGDLDLVDHELGRTVSIHTGRHDRDFAAAFPLVHGLLLQTGDLPIDTGDALLDLFNGVEGSLQSRHPASQRILLSRQPDAELLEPVLLCRT